MILTSIKDAFDVYTEGISSIENTRENLITSSLMFALCTSIGYGLCTRLYSYETVQALKVTLIPSSVITFITAILIFLYPRMQMDSKIRSIEETLLSTTSYMSVLASSGMSIERIMEKLAVIEKNPVILSEVQIFLTDIKLFGKPVSVALEEMADRTADSTFSKMMSGIVNTVNTSGDLSSYLKYETKQLIVFKDEETKSILTKLGYMGEIYIAALVVGPILFIIMLSLLSGLDISTGVSSMTLLNTMVFIGLPIISTAFLIFLDNIMGSLD